VVRQQHKKTTTGKRKDLRPTTVLINVFVVLHAINKVIKVGIQIVVPSFPAAFQSS